MKSTRKKTGNILIFALSLPLLLLFLWRYSDSGSQPLSRPSVSDKQPDVYAFNALDTQYDQQGILSKRLTSDYIEQRPHNNSVVLKKPIIQLYQGGQLSWTIRAKRGTVYQRKGNNSKIVLQGQASVISADDINQLHSKKLVFFPDKNIVRTDQAVTLNSMHGITHATGLKANLNEGKQHIQLLNRVKGQYHAVSAP